MRFVSNALWWVFFVNSGLTYTILQLCWGAEPLTHVLAAAQWWSVPRSQPYFGLLLLHGCLSSMWVNSMCGGEWDSNSEYPKPAWQWVNVYMHTCVWERNRYIYVVFRMAFFCPHLFFFFHIYQCWGVFLGIPEVDGKARWQESVMVS